MASATDRDGWRRHRWRIGGWSLVAGLLLLPLVAMQFTDEVQWTPSDFIVMGILLGGTGLMVELVFWFSHDLAYRAAAGVGLFGALFLVWSNLAVGLIGSENEPVNALFFVVLFLGAIAASFTRYRAKGMAYTMYTMAAAQASIAVYAAITGAGDPNGGVIEVMVVNAFFVAIWATSAGLFLRAADQGAGRSGRD